MLGNTPDSIDPSISDHLAVQILSQMLDFDHPDLDLRISIDPKSKLKQSTRFPSIRFDKIAQLKYGKALTSKNRIDGEYSVMGSNGIDGNHKEFLVKGPGVVVGRKGSAGKVVFSEGNFWPIDTTYWLDADHKKISPLFAYWLLKWLDLTTLVGKKAIGVPGLNRKDVHRSFIPDVPISIQEKIIGEITKIDENLKDADLLKISVMDKYLA
jgi:restriction endonuclease S subunit